MANTVDDDDITTRREKHYSNQRSSYRSSLRSDTSAGLPPRSRTLSDLRRLEDFDLEKTQTERADSEILPSPGSTSSPAPNVPYTRSRENSDVKRNRRSAGKGASRSRPGSRIEDERALEDLLAQESWLHLYELNEHSPVFPPPLQTPRSREQIRHTNRDHASRPTSRGSRAQRSRRPSFPLRRETSAGISGSQLDITALPSVMDAKDEDLAEQYTRSKRTPQAQSASKVATELYTLSYLIFFSIWGTLARLGLQTLTFYSGTPVTFPVLWANVAGTFIMGFLAEDRQLFRAEWGNQGDRLPEPSGRPAEESKNAKARHGKVKKTIPMYIGLATGFCGSFTSFSSFVRDIFLALSNDLRSPINHPYPSNTPIPPVSTTVGRNGGYSFMAICATVIVTITVCYCALKVGAHLALLLDPIMPTLRFRSTRRVIDPLIVVLGWGIWLGAVLMAIFTPHNAWRGQALFACIFAPIGCLARYYISLYLNPIMPSFPLGTFTVNIFGTAVLGMAYDLQHVPFHRTGAAGGSIVSCQVLQGIMDGFCGALTTVSTWILELDTLKTRHAYVYGSTSVISGLCLLVIIMGSIRWTVGWETILCPT